MCCYCDSVVGKKLDSRCAEYVISQGKLEVWYSAWSSEDSFQEEIKINNCPMCGKRLGKVHIVVGNFGQVRKSKKVTWNKN